MRRSSLAWGLAAIDVVTFSVVSLVDPEPDYGAIALYFVGIASFVAVGALLVSRVPANPIGLLLLAAGTASVASAVIGVYANLGALQAPRWPGFELARRIGDASFLYPIVIALVGVPLVFPDGRLPSPRFRWVVAITIANQVAWTFGALLATGGATSADNVLVGPIEMVVLFSTLVAFGGAATAVTVRYRRGNLVQREQIKWLGAVVCVAAVVLPAGLLLYNDAPGLSNLLFIIGIVALFALPIVIGIAILRYRLFEIDRIISRTIGYVIITTALIAAYAGIVVVIGGPLGHVTGGDTISVALSTLVVAALFQPLRRRVQTIVDRRFDRARIDADRTTAAFSERLRHEVDIGTVTTDLHETVHVALRPERLEVWLRKAPDR